MWKIEELGDDPSGYDTFSFRNYSGQDHLTVVSLYLPAPGRPRCSYNKLEQVAWSSMVLVPEMEVLARVCAAPSERDQLRIETKWKVRLKRWQQLRTQARTFKKSRERAAAKKRLKEWEEKNADLVWIYKRR